MWPTWFNVIDMTKMIQIRNVPDQVHREVKTRAIRAGMSLSDYLLREIEHLIEAPTIEEVLDRRGSRRRPSLSETPAEAVRAERAAR
jgi:antitoxin FitA